MCRKEQKGNIYSVDTQNITRNMEKYRGSSYKEQGLPMKLQNKSL